MRPYATVSLEPERPGDRPYAASLLQAHRAMTLGSLDPGLAWSTWKVPTISEAALEVFQVEMLGIEGV